MEDRTLNGSIDRQVGFLAGQIKGLTDAVKELSGRFDQHMKEHRVSWTWIIPALISMATLIVLIVSVLKA